MTYDEIRGAFTDARRRLRELAWLEAEVGRIRVLAENLLPTSHAHPMTRLTTRFDLGQLKAIRLSLFDDLSRDRQLVDWLDRLDADCTSVNEVLAPLAAFAMGPRDRSFSGSAVDGAYATQKAEQILVDARNVLTGLQALPR